MSSQIILAKDFDVKKVTFSEPRKNQKKAQRILLNYEFEGGRRGPLIIQTPKLHAPFGVDCSKYEDGNKFSVNVSLSHDTKDQNPVSHFRNIIQTLDELVKDSAFKNSTKWFESKKSMEVLSEFFKPCIKYAKEKDDNGEIKKDKNGNDIISKKYPPTLNLKLAVYDGKPGFSLYNQKKEEIDIIVDNEVNLGCIRSGSYITALIQCTGIYFISKTNFGLSWRLVQAKIDQPAMLIGYSIIEETDKEETDEEESNGSPYEDYEE